MRVRLLAAGILTAMVFATFPSVAVAVLPPTTEQQIASIGFETGDSRSFELHRVPAISTAYWGPITNIKHSGNRSLWAAGTVYPGDTPSTFFPTYPEGTNGWAQLNLTELADYYSARLSFYYLCPTRGAADSDSFVFHYDPGAPGGDDRIIHLADVGSWTQKTYDLTQPANGAISREPVDLQFSFSDAVEGGGIPIGNGQGPAIDDFLVTGYKYGPPRSVAATHVGSKFRTSWLRPYNSVGETTGDVRTLAYRVWRSPFGMNTWTEVSGARLGDSTASFDDPIADEGVSYEYFVQAWDPGIDPGYGQGVKSGPVSAPAANPTIALTAPAAEFPIDAGPVTVSGTASDSGSGVSTVGVRIRRSDGKCWSGSLWTDLETWLTPGTHPPDWATWSMSWTPDAEVIASGQIVSISARATDGTGRTATTAAVSSAANGAISLGGGEPYTKNNPIPVAISATDSPSIRFKVGGVFDSRGWMPYTTSTTVPVPAGDGLKTVDCEFSSDGGSSTYLTASDSITLDTTKPTVEVTSPSSGFSPAGGAIGGTTGDSGAGVAAVRLTITSKSAAGTTYYWNGLDWTPDAVSRNAETLDGWAHWSFSPAPTAAVWSYSAITITATAADGVDNQNSDSVTSSDPADPCTLTISRSPSSGVIAYKGTATIAGVLKKADSSALSGKPVRLQYYSSGVWKTTATKNTDGAGKVSFGVSPRSKTTYRLYLYASGYQTKTTASAVVTPKVYLTKPTRPSSARKNRTFTSYGYIKPKHKASSYPVKILAYRYQKMSNGKYGYVLRRTFRAKAYTVSSTKSKYKASVRLPYTGRWKLRAWAPTDSAHYSTYGSYTSSFRVK